ncbi:glucan endo-1,3-beta-glucosidase 12-like [Hibiscus syriacus]|uniref:glucan endo-1,3-beta-glucosidase 12-like n=1 Tax=Hibiscus syriacus TaxID=106335 RepID=UPI001920FD1F|nr:glucan endo-1,3-beta-glucosidase 12-like [Hibiscus syriacus]
MGIAIKYSKKLQLMSKLMSLVIVQPTNDSNTQPYGVSPPFSLPPFDSLPPSNRPPYFPPPSSTSGTVPSPTPTSSSGPISSPPSYIPSPFGSHTSPLVFLPPIVYPPPTVPPPPYVAPNSALWCVAKPSVPDPIVQEAMNYACVAGADCDSIQPSGSCFQPDSLFAHASYAFNSYWQKTKVDGGTCEFGGTAILVAADPSYDGCQFEYHN